MRDISEGMCFAMLFRLSEESDREPDGTALKSEQEQERNLCGSSVCLLRSPLVFYIFDCMKS